VVLVAPQAPLPSLRSGCRNHAWSRALLMDCQEPLRLSCFLLVRVHGSDAYAVGALCSRDALTHARGRTVSTRWIRDFNFCGTRPKVLSVRPATVRAQNTQKRAQQLCHQYNATQQPTKSICKLTSLQVEPLRCSPLPARMQEGLQLVHDRFVITATLRCAAVRLAALERRRQEQALALARHARGTLRLCPHRDKCLGYACVGGDMAAN
jgi:hypothetical protein